MGLANKPENKGVAEVIIAKQRNGSLGTAMLGWRGEFTRFIDPTMTGKEKETD